MKKVAVDLATNRLLDELLDTHSIDGAAATMQCLTERQAAAILRCSRALLRKWRRVKGDGPRFYKIGRLIRYSVKDLQVWLEAHRAAGNHGNLQI